MVSKNASGTVTKKVQYEYDVLDRRIGKKIDATGDGTYETATYWVYNDAGKRDLNTGAALDDIVLEFTDADGDGSGAATLSTRYLHGMGFDQILASETVSGNVVTWALADDQSTVGDQVNRQTLKLFLPLAFCLCLNVALQRCHPDCSELKPE